MKVEDFVEKRLRKSAEEIARLEKHCNGSSCSNSTDRICKRSIPHDIQKIQANRISLTSLLFSTIQPSKKSSKSRRRKRSTTILNELVDSVKNNMRSKEQEAVVKQHEDDGWKVINEKTPQGHLLIRKGLVYRYVHKNGFIEPA
jgi:hypothetical protein